MSYNYLYEFSIEAKEDLLNITNYIAKTLLNPKAAADLLDEIDVSLERVCAVPFCNKLDDDPRLATLGIRRLIVKKYILFYFVNQEDKAIQVARIAHGSENTSKLVFRPYTI